MPGEKKRWVKSLDVIPLVLKPGELITVNQRIYNNHKRLPRNFSVSQTYEPTVSVTTKKSENHIIITVSEETREARPDDPFGRREGTEFIIKIPS